MTMYHHLLCYQDEFDRLKADFDIQKFLRKQATPEDREYAKDCDDNVQIHLKKVLNRNLTAQFGTKAPEKLKRLLFMLRENQDVFKVFCEKFVEFQM
jgi:hypothetical protein